jgi:peptide/nickel transport system substrate-binding protein
VTPPPSPFSRPISRRSFLGGVSALALTGLLTACGSKGSSGSSSSGAAASGSGGSGGTTVVEAVAAVPGGLAFDSKPGGYEAFEFTLLTGCGLIRNPYKQATDDPNAETQDLYKFEGVLAESYDVSADGLTYTFHLRKGIKSQAGNPFTADDVIYSYARKWNSTSITPSISLPAITDPSKQVAKVDDYTVTITVAEKGHGFPLLSVISKISGEIYDSTLLKSKATAADPYAVTWSNTAGNFGYGPFMMTEYKDGEQITYASNPNYPLGEPKIKKLIQRVVPDAGNRATLVKNGDVDVAVQLLPADVADMAKNKGVTTFHTDTNNFSWIFLNANRAPFNNKLVRQALFYAVPYQQIIDQVYKGKANPVIGLLDPNSPGYDGDGLLKQTYDPAKSKALLAQAGVSTPVKYEVMMSNAVPDMQQMAVQLQSFAKDAGFEVTISVVPPATFSDKNTTGDWDMRIYRDMSVSYESPPYSLLLAFPHNNPLRNTSGFDVPEYYAAVNAGVEAGDSLSAAAGKEWNAAQLIWQDFRPQVQVAKVEPLMVFHSGVKGFVHRTDNVLDFSVMTKS